MTFPRYGVDRDFNFFYRECAIFILPASQVERWVFPRSFSVFVQYFRRVLKNVDNEQVRKPAICDVFVCKQTKCLQTKTNLWRVYYLFIIFLADKKLEKS